MEKQSQQVPQLPPQGITAAQVGQNFQAEMFASCARGDHQVVKQYGMCGIITAVACFPCGLICLFSDVTRKCNRCGAVIQ